MLGIEMSMVEMSLTIKRYVRTLWSVNEGELDILTSFLQQIIFVAFPANTTQFVFMAGSWWILGGLLVDF